MRKLFGWWQVVAQRSALRDGRRRARGPLRSLDVNPEGFNPQPSAFTSDARCSDLVSEGWAFESLPRQLDGQPAIRRRQVTLGLEPGTGLDPSASSRSIPALLALATALTPGFDPHRRQFLVGRIVLYSLAFAPRLRARRRPPRLAAALRAGEA